MPSGPARFRMPDFLQRRHPGFGLFNIICRVSADGRQADLWVQVHHAGTDGLPVQELLSRLEQEWGVCSPIHFPTPEEFAALSVPELCSPPGAARDIYHLHDFVDFAPLLALRKQVNERLAGQIGAEVTLGGLLLWALMHDPTLLGGTCLATVEVPASMDEERSVNFVGIRPGDFIRPADRMAGFVRFAQEFNARVVETRERRSNLYLATSATASMPVGLHAWLMHWNLGRPGFHTPTLGLSLVRDAKVVVSPMGDIGFADGFIAIGNLSLPTAGAQAVGCVSIKGTRDRVEVLRSAMRQAIVRCREYV